MLAKKPMTTLDIYGVKTRTDDFDYVLDESRIAQSPAEKRDESKLLVVDRKTGHLEHESFFDIKKHLKKGDL